MPTSGSDNGHPTGIGTYLREAREAQGKSLDAAAGVTRIGKNYLIAIEEEAFAKFPNAAYLKGFLRIYAGYLGLSGDDVVARYDRLLAPAAGKEGELPHKAAGEGDGEPKRNSRWWRVPAILLVLTSAAGLLMEKKERHPTQLTPSGKSSPPVPSQLPPQPVQLPQRSPAPTAAADAANGLAPLGVNEGKRGKGSILKLKVNQDSALTITIDDDVSQPYELKSGDLIEWKADRSFTLDLSNAGGIEAEFNGRHLPPFGGPGASVHVVLKGEGPGQ